MVPMTCQRVNTVKTMKFKNEQKTVFWMTNLQGVSVSLVQFDFHY